MPSDFKLFTQKSTNSKRQRQKSKNTRITANSLPGLSPPASAFCCWKFFCDRRYFEDYRRVRMSFANPQMLWLLAVFPPLLLVFFWWAWRKRQQLVTQFIQA